MKYDMRIRGRNNINVAVKETSGGDHTIIRTRETPEAGCLVILSGDDAVVRNVEINNVDSVSEYLRSIGMTGSIAVSASGPTRGKTLCFV